MIKNSWMPFFEQEFKKEYFLKLKEFLKNEIQNKKTIYPLPENIFRAFELCEWNNVSVVIIGQDCYHTPDAANGLAFAITNGIKIQPSLSNIFKELEYEYNKNNCSSDLEHWAKQGILLLNSILTVEKGQPLSHANKGWEIFTGNIIKYLNEEKEHIVFVCWGNKALEICNEIDKNKHSVITTTHPSPFSFYKGFYKSNCFKQINSALKRYNKPLIDWFN